MEDNSDMLGPITSKAGEVGGNGEDAATDLVESADLVEVLGNDDSGDIGMSAGEQSHQPGTHSRLVWSMYLVRVQVKTGNPRVLRKVVSISGKYGDYIKEIQASHKLVYPAYRIASEGSPTLVFTYGSNVYCLGAPHSVAHMLTSLAATKTHYLGYWKEGGG